MTGLSCQGNLSPDLVEADANPSPDWGANQFLATAQELWTNEFRERKPNQNSHPRAGVWRKSRNWRKTTQKQQVMKAFYHHQGLFLAGQPGVKEPATGAESILRPADENGCHTICGPLLVPVGMTESNRDPATN